MGCQGEVELTRNLTFSVCTHDPDTGVLTDADSAPTYRIYEDETATAILTGTMATLDTANTVGFYSEQIACTAANGFEEGKSYTIYIEATVDGDTGGMCYGFRVTSKTGYSLGATGLNAISTTAPTGPATNFPEMLVQSWRRWFKKADMTATQIKTYADDGTTIITTQAISDDNVTQIQGAAT